MLQLDIQTGQVDIQPALVSLQVQIFVVPKHSLVRAFHLRLGQMHPVTVGRPVVAVVEPVVAAAGLVAVVGLVAAELAAAVVVEGLVVVEAGAVVVAVWLCQCFGLFEPAVGGFVVVGLAVGLLASRNVAPLLQLEHL